LFPPLSEPSMIQLYKQGVIQVLSTIMARHAYTIMLKVCFRIEGMCLG